MTFRKSVQKLKTTNICCAAALPYSQYYLGGADSQGNMYGALLRRPRVAVWRATKGVDQFRRSRVAARLSVATSKHARVRPTHACDTPGLKNTVFLESVTVVPQALALSTAVTIIQHLVVEHHMFTWDDVANNSAMYAAVAIADTALRMAERL